MAAVSEKIELLGGIPLFSGLTESELNTLFQHSSIRKYEKNTIVINDGDDDSTLYVIISGRVKVFLKDENGKEVILNHMVAGEYFGELALLEQVKRSASVITVQPCQFIIITSTDFIRCVSTHHEIALRVMRNMSARLRDLSAEVKSLALQDVSGRISRVLLKLAQDRGGRLIITECPSRHNLAKMVGSSRETVTRILKDMEKRGCITISGRTITFGSNFVAD
ncbi:cAMP-binding proteins - catabolite gene activator and regulatory subunit of cAMP-dependent protein kinases [hydrothermal vent metagenome]|uniref:cAMP-binding proteins - catabolite gene activator and regulatory subunit of cAMP-dependent protein kinases n=1 Tax=hydrothermal vent metagenome TaxID=652676 RepID=A0A3B1ASX6_9ZZZZ